MEPSPDGRVPRLVPTLAVFVIACAAAHGRSVALAPAPAPAAAVSTAPEPVPTPAPVAAAADGPAVTATADPFERTIRPILFRTCTPCHVPGGRMYERMPFDQAQVVRDHREGVLRRLKGEDRAAVEAWLEAAPPARP